MIKLALHGIAIVVMGTAAALLSIVANHGLYLMSDNVTQQTEGAFRDGLFLGRLDADHGRGPHLASGRWSSASDRHLFIGGYLQAYREARGTDSQPDSGLPTAMENGYRDGITDGLQQRYRSAIFYPSATENYRKADHGYSDSDGDVSQYKQAYREGYRNGYQEGYYANVEKLETARVSGPE